MKKVISAVLVVALLSGCGMLYKGGTGPKGDKGEPGQTIIVTPEPTQVPTVCNNCQELEQQIVVLKAKVQRLQRRIRRLRRYIRWLLKHICKPFPVPYPHLQKGDI